MPDRLRIAAGLTAGFWLTAGVNAAVATAASAPAVDCGSPATTAAMAQCAYDDFLAASAEQAAALRALRTRLPPARLPAWQRAQKAWLTWRTQTCAFEASAAAGGSLGPVLQWQCAARLTRERSAALADIGVCREGELGCRQP